MDKDTGRLAGRSNRDILDEFLEGVPAINDVDAVVLLATVINESPLKDTVYPSTKLICIFMNSIF